MPPPMDRLWEVRKQLGQRIRYLRKSLGLTQQQLAARAGITPRLLGQLERGKGNPTLETLANVATALGVSCAIAILDEKLKRSKDGSG